MSQPTIANVERELVECQQECGRLIGQLQEARAQAYEEIAQEAEKRSKGYKELSERDVLDEWFDDHYSKHIVLEEFEEWLRSESRRIRESK